MLLPGGPYASGASPGGGRGTHPHRGGRLCGVTPTHIRLAQGRIGLGGRGPGRPALPSLDPLSLVP